MTTTSNPSGWTSVPAGRRVERLIDLRSDTVTRPSAGMRRAMAEAEVGDDVFGEDPTVNRLQERAAALLGKEAALFVPSGSMANQIALKVHCQPGDEVIVGEGAHNYLYEAGAGGALAGVQFALVGRGGLYTGADVEAAFKPESNHSFAATRLVCVENTHNRGGGAVWPPGPAGRRGGGGPAAGAGAAPRRRAPAERRRRAGRAGGGAGGAVRHRQPVLLEGPGRAGGIGAGGQPRGHRPGPPVAQDAGRGHAPGGRAGGGGAVRARPQRGTPGRGSRATPGCWPSDWRSSRGWRWIWRARRPTL